MGPKLRYPAVCVCVLLMQRFGLRWFTPKVEVPLCGHATLATAAVLFYKIGNCNSKYEKYHISLCIIGWRFKPEAVLSRFMVIARFEHGSAFVVTLLQL